MNKVNLDILKWLANKDYWLQVAAKKTIEKEPFTNSVISELSELLKTGKKYPKLQAINFDELLDNQNTKKDLRLISLGEIEGIDALAPRNALEFGNSNLTVIFGNNGSGKSGYTRILKKMCGMPNSVELRPDVYTPTPKNQHCSIEYSVDGKKYKELWVSNSKAIDTLKSIDIFDSSSGKIYLDEDSEVSYVPESVSLFENLVSVCSQIKELLFREKNALVSKLPNIPPEFQDTNAYRAFTTLTGQIESQTLSDHFLWTESDEQQFKNSNQRLSSPDHLVLSNKKENNHKQLNSILNEIKAALEKVNDDACMKIYSAQNNASLKRKAAIEGVKVTTDTALLDGVGSQTWVALWQAAKEYSKSEAYTNCKYPHTEDDALCVLCHQTITPDAKTRLKAFETYIHSSLETSAKNAENDYKKLLDSLPISPSHEDICTKIHAAGLPEDKWLKPLTEVWSLISTKVYDLKSERLTLLKGVKQQASILIKLEKSIASLENEVRLHKADAIKFERPKVSLQLKELKAKKWCFSQLEAIKDELERLKKIKEYDGWITKTHTSSISIQAGKISKEVITDAYIRRFNSELKRLGAQNIKVELIKTKVAKGKVKHQVRLKGQTSKTATIDAPKVLSDGEHRIVTLAAFFADFIEKENNSSFIFDDPISSLDQQFEEKTIERLVTLSADRQVIIFTHRLSFLSLITEMGKPHSIHIRREPWGTGEPGEIPIFGKHPIKAIKHLKNERLQRAKKTYNTEGSEAYYPLGKSICSDIRILIERIVETDFLAEVVQRHRRAVHTLKVEELAKISTDDCKFIEKIMTKYSSFEHSQSLEFPVVIPAPDEIETTLNEIINWHLEFKNRTW